MALCDRGPYRLEFVGKGCLHIAAGFGVRVCSSDGVDEMSQGQGAHC